jgi:DNA-binding transcriptional LysR family regulator
MKISLRQLQVFVSVAEQGSTMAAANAVALSQSAASAALNELEHMLNTQLFDRIGKRLLLNDNGRLLMPQARLILDAANSIELQFSSGDANWSCIRIGASTTIGSYCLPALLAASPVTDSQLTASAQHTMSHPQMTIANTADIVSAVANYEVDFGFIEGLAIARIYG